MAETFLRRVEGLEPGDHACLVYDDEGRRDHALLSFLTRGIGRGDRVLYLARAPDDPIVAALSRSASPEQFAALFADDCYLHEGTFDVQRVLDGFRRVLDEAAALGFSTIRTAGGPPAIVTDNGSSGLLPGYERQAGALFRDGKLVSVCTYDARRVPPAALLGIVDAHPIVLYGLGPDARLEVRLVSACSLALAGWVDLTTLGSLTRPLAGAVASGGDVLVDLRDVDFVDVAGLRLLAEAARELRARGWKLTLEHAPDPVPAMVQLLGYEEQGLMLA
jgi:anti-anti-sigma factor